MIMNEKKHQPITLMSQCTLMTTLCYEGSKDSHTAIEYKVRGWGAKPNREAGLEPWQLIYLIIIIYSRLPG